MKEQPAVYESTILVHAKNPRYDLLDLTRLTHFLVYAQLGSVTELAPLKPRCHQLPDRVEAGPIDLDRPYCLQQLKISAEAKLPRLVTERKGDRLRLEWDVPGDLPFPMPVQVQAGDLMMRVEVPAGGAETPLHGAQLVVVDPFRWILKDES